MLGRIMAGVKMGRLIRRLLQDYEIRLSEGQKQEKGRDARETHRQYAPSFCDHGERILGVQTARVPSVDVHLLVWPFRKRQATVGAESVKGLSSSMGSSHSLPLLQLSLCECRTCRMTVLTEEHLYMRPNLGYVRKGVRSSVSQRTIGLGEERRSPLYSIHNVGTLWAARR